MREPLAPDEDVVFREFTRLDGEPDQIPAELYAGFLELMANSCNLSSSVQTLQQGISVRIKCGILPPVR